MNRLILYVVTTGLLPDVIVIADLIAYISAPQTLWFVGIATFITTGYCNSFLSMLNMRDYLLTSTDDRNRRRPGADSETLPMSHIQFNVLDTVRANDTVGHRGAHEMHIGSDSQRPEPHRDEGTAVYDNNKISIV